MTQPGLLAGANVVLDAGVRAVTGLEELCAGGRGVGGHQLVAPPVGDFEQGQLGAGVGLFAAADDPQVRGPGRQPVAVGVLAQ